MVSFDYASLKDISEIRELLKSEAMLSHDLEENIGSFLIAKDGDILVGVVGLEIYGKYGLIRSFCVDQSYQNKRLGGELLSRIISSNFDSGVVFQK